MKMIEYIWNIYDRDTIAKKYSQYMNFCINMVLFFSPSVILAISGKFDLWNATKFLLEIIWDTFQEHPFTAVFRIASYPILLPVFAIMTLPINFFCSTELDSIFKGLSILQSAGAILLLPICYLFYNEYKDKEFVSKDTFKTLFLKLSNPHGLTNSEHTKLLSFIENYKAQFPQADLTNEQTINHIILNIMGSQDIELLAAVARPCPKDSDLFNKLEQTAAHCKPWPLDNANSLLWTAAKQINGGKLKVREATISGEEKILVSEIYVAPKDGHAAPEEFSHLQATIDKAAPFYRA